MGTWTTTPRTWVAGEIPTAAMFNSNLRDFGRAFSDAWTSYTPALTASTTNPTNWTRSGYYMQAGKVVIARFQITASGTMTAGSGTYRIGLPVNAAAAAITDIPVGQVYLSDYGTGGWVGFAYVAAATYLHLAYTAASVGGGVTLVANNTPWTWAANDSIAATIVYEAA